MLTTISVSGIQITVFRDDLNHALLSGNKLHKLAPNIEAAKARECSRIVSFGGPYSNHLHALAWVCRDAGLKSLGIVRGEIPVPLTPTLADCQKWGMQLAFMPRKNYRQYQQVLASYTEPCLAIDLNIEPFFQTLEDKHSTLVVPEGGSNLAAIKSLSNAYQKVFNKVEHLGITHAVCATGTGATVAGLGKASPERIAVIGMQAVAEHDATLQRVQTWLNSATKTPSIVECHLGRFAKITPKLTKFIKQFEIQYDIPLDPIYTGKAMLKLSEMIEAGYFKSSDHVLFIHTGGLQGRRGTIKRH